MQALPLSSVVFLLAVAIAPLGAQSESKDPPPGAPWTKSFVDAQREACAAGKPIFVYSTKTYCPHCVVMEKGLLSDPKLSELHDDVVWMYLFQDFSHSEADRRAERVAIRFGITSWPQHFLVDPYTLDVLADTGRSLATFEAAVAGAKVTKQTRTTTDAYLEVDRLAARLEGDEVTVDEAKRYLDHGDVVVRYRAIQRLEATAPAEIAEAADALLEIPHDQTRFLVCKVLAQSGDARAKNRLEQLLRSPDGSKNPNVLRIQAVGALARCGDAETVAVIAPFASSGVYFNGLTGTSVDALVAIAERMPNARKAVCEVLASAFPEPEGQADERARRACRALAQRVHEALRIVTGEERPFPAEYDPATRKRLIEQWLIEQWR